LRIEYTFRPVAVWHSREIRRCARPEAGGPRPVID
jgi:hypothetical protein